MLLQSEPVAGAHVHVVLLAVISHVEAVVAVQVQAVVQFVHGAHAHAATQAAGIGAGIAGAVGRCGIINLSTFNKKLGAFL